MRTGPQPARTTDQQLLRRLTELAEAEALGRLHRLLDTRPAAPTTRRRTLLARTGAVLCVLAVIVLYALVVGRLSGAPLPVPTR